MIRFLAGLMQSLRPLIVVGIALGFVMVYFTYGLPGVWLVSKLVAVGILMNLPIWLAVRWFWRWKTQRGTK